MCQDQNVTGLSAPDIVAHLTTAMPPQGFGGSQGSDGDYHWPVYEQYLQLYRLSLCRVPRGYSAGKYRKSAVRTNHYLPLHNR